MRVGLNKGAIQQDIKLKESLKGIRFDKSALLLLITNVITIFFAVYEGWSLAVLMIIYFMEVFTIYRQNVNFLSTKYMKKFYKKIITE